MSKKSKKKVRRIPVGGEEAMSDKYLEQARPLCLERKSFHDGCDAGAVAKKAKPEPMVTCLDCGYEQPDMGVGVACEECGGPTTPPAKPRRRTRRTRK